MKNTKKLVIMLALFLMGSLFFASKNDEVLAAVVPYYADGIHYNLDDTTNEATVTTHTQADVPTDVVIPSTITSGGNTYTVTKIGVNALSSIDANSITLPNTLTTISDYAFANATITSITIPGSVTSIGNSSFHNGALTDLVIEEGVQTIGNDAFANLPLVNVTLPVTLTNLSDSAFSNSSMENLFIRHYADLDMMTTFLKPKLDSWNLIGTNLKMYALDHAGAKYQDGTLSEYIKLASTLQPLVGEYLGLVQVKNYNKTTKAWDTITNENVMQGTPTYAWFKKSTSGDMQLGFSSTFQASGSGTYYLKVNDDIVLSDILVRNIHPISYSLNGGTNDPTNPTSYTYGDGVASFKPATKEGFVFTGWFDNATGGNQITSISNTLDTNVILHAQWELAIYNITYDPNGGLGEVVDTNGYNLNDNAVAKTSDGIVKDGYTFDGWNTKADGTGTKYLADDTIVVSGDITLYAQWKFIPYNITYDPNGGTGLVSDTTGYEINTNAIVKNGTELSKDGYVFDGWNTKADGTGTRYIANSQIKVTGNITLYAHWNKIIDSRMYSITYDANTGNGSVSDDSYYWYESIATIKSGSTLSKEGYIFSSWNTKADGSGLPYNVGDKIGMVENLTLYAIYTPIEIDVTYTISYDSNGGTGQVVDSNKYELNDSVEVKDITGVSKEGYVFVGWNTSKDGSGTMYSPSSSILIDDNITLYAQWKVEKVIVLPKTGISTLSIGFVSVMAIAAGSLAYFERKK